MKEEEGEEEEEEEEGRMYPSRGRDAGRRGKKEKM
jgi:hypothetical protein